MNTIKRKCWNLRGNNYGLIWLEKNFLGGIFKCHVSIDRKMADFMLVSTEKTVYKSTCKSATLQLPSDHLELRNSSKNSDPRTIYRIATLLRKVSSDFQAFFNPGILLEKWLSKKWLQVQNSVLFLKSDFNRHSFPLVYQFVHHCEKIRKFGLSMMLEDLNIKLDLLKLSSSLYPRDTRICWTRITKIKHFL